MPFGIQPIHIVIIVVIGFLLFGANKLPDLGRSAGKAISEFRKGAKEMTDGFHVEMNQPGTTQAVGPTIQPPPASIPEAPTLSTTNVSAPFQTSYSAPAERFCIQCGSPNPPEAYFCSNCGTKIPERPT